jgi:hypothetical protein
MTKVDRGYDGGPSKLECQTIKVGQCQDRDRTARGGMYVPSQDLLPSLKVGFSPVQKGSGVKTSTASVAACKLTFDELLGDNPLAAASDSSLAFECNAYTKQTWLCTRLMRSIDADQVFWPRLAIYTE